MDHVVRLTPDEWEDVLRAVRWTRDHDHLCAVQFSDAGKNLAAPAFKASADRLDALFEKIAKAPNA